ncbi:hypothetical protein CI109_103280 [Kwoniella shandongensis]|uniref:Uncharacterized protein n=1 Tax=Kwoniella shandongensis TaxID=1734106 RepID=A0A5M6BS36_9TREE|nr:uncharacterized protein CI109_006048 [Kwoniella shandongensis]KAA5525597.1 hypothetical protein CI109_006048 [Kwoniella shandongensis]
MNKIALILGSGARVGQAVTTKFLSAGYKVATVSRSAKTTPSDRDDLVHISADLSDPKAVEPVFDVVQQKWGSPPLVVIYNAAQNQPITPNPLTASIDQFTSALNINTVSSYTAASIAYSRNNKVTFIYTGNALSSDTIVPNLTVLGVGKSASSHWVQTAAASTELRPATFYYCDQRDLQGGPCYTGLNGQAHADLYLKLAEQEEQGEPLVVFRAPLEK